MVAVEPANGNIVSQYRVLCQASSQLNTLLVLLLKQALKYLFILVWTLVSLEGKPFTVRVTEGQQVAAVIFLAQLTWSAIREAGH